MSHLESSAPVWPLCWDKAAQPWDNAVGSSPGGRRQVSNEARKSRLWSGLASQTPRIRGSRNRKDNRL